MASNKISLNDMTSMITKINLALRQLMRLAFSATSTFFSQMSIYKLTLLGFILVTFPLVTILISSANYVNKLTEQSTNAIYHVAQLTQLKRKLDDAINKMERSASQYVVLKDYELLQVFQRQQNILINTIEKTHKSERDLALKQHLNTLRSQCKLIKSLVLSDQIENLSLAQLQLTFKTLHTLANKVGKRSGIVANQQVKAIEQTTQAIRNTILTRLYIIPITLFVAVVFILLITKPLKRLVNKIKRLEQGDFEQEITLTGPPEIVNIVNALEQMRVRLHSLELQKSSFIRHISHELKTPLAAIREGTELIYDNSVGSLNEDQQEICNIIRGSVTRLQRLIEDLLAFNIVLDSTSLHGLERVNLPELINNACEVRKLEIQSKKIKLICTGSPCHIYSNSKQLSVILDNILSNAIKYSPIEGRITINYLSKPNNILLTLIDEGTGIAPNIKEKVFDAFYQGQAPVGNKIKGSGLGLTIVKELLLRLSGSIAITDAHKYHAKNNQGTCVSITLPNRQLENR